MDDFVDTADFDLTYMMNLWYGYRDLLPADVRAAMEQHMRSFKFWFTDPQPAGTIDQRYYWSENHRLLFHADEYLAGQAFPNDGFGSDGNTGAWHKARARGFIDDWLTEKARFGFTEWHSDVYYQKTADALLTIIDWVDDPVLVQRASSILDLLFLHRFQHQRGTSGRTHGARHEGQERRDRSNVQHVRPVRRHALRSHRLESAPHCTRSVTPPAASARAVSTPRSTRNMGVLLDSAPVGNGTMLGYRSRPKNVDSGGRREPVADGPARRHRIKYGLWSGLLPFKPIADITGGDRNVAQTLAQQLLMLGRVVHGSRHLHLPQRRGDAVDRVVPAGPGSEQHHVPQATLDEARPSSRRIRRTNPSRHGVARRRRLLDRERKPPRAARHGALDELYAPIFEAVAAHCLRLLAVHRVLPQSGSTRSCSRGMDLRAQGAATSPPARSGHAWRTYEDPAIHARSAPALDLVADGGAGNVADSKSATRRNPGTAEFRAVLAHPAQSRSPAVSALAGGFDVSYGRRPAYYFWTTGPLRVKGADLSLSIPASATTTPGRSPTSARRPSRSPTRPAP
jgi:hypothetical protein